MVTVTRSVVARSWGGGRNELAEHRILGAIKILCIILYIMIDTLLYICANPRKCSTESEPSREPQARSGDRVSP